METYAGIDLHSSNNYIGIINEQDQRLYGKRIPNELDRVLMALEPFRDTLQGVVVINIQLVLVSRRFAGAWVQVASG